MSSSTASVRSRRALPRPSGRASRGAQKWGYHALTAFYLAPHAPQVADWAGESTKSGHRAAPACRPRTSGSRLHAALPSTGEVDSPTLSVGSSLYSLYTEASSEEGAGQATASPGAPETPHAAAAKVWASAAAAGCSCRHGLA